MKFTLADVMLSLIPMAFGIAYIAPWFVQRPIEWHRFSTETLAKTTSDGETALILFKPRLGFMNDIAVTRLNHPTIQRAIHSRKLSAMDYEFGYAESIPDGEHDEIKWLMNQPAYHKDAFAVIAFPNGTTIPVDAMDPNDLITKLSLKSNGRLYLWLAVASLCVLVGRVVLSRKSRDNKTMHAKPDLHA